MTEHTTPKQVRDSQAGGEQTTTRPPRSPRRARPARPRPHAQPGRPHAARHSDDVTTDSVAKETEPLEPKMEGGGGSGRGPIDDDGRRRPERPDGNNATRLLIALGILALGTAVMSARLLAKNGRLGRAS